jgi:hypothetical protein
MTPIAQVGRAKLIIALPPGRWCERGRRFAGHVRSCLRPPIGLSSARLPIRLHSFERIAAGIAVPGAAYRRQNYRHEQRQVYRVARNSFQVIRE